MHENSRKTVPADPGEPPVAPSGMGYVARRPVYVSRRLAGFAFGMACSLGALQVPGQHRVLGFAPPLRWRTTPHSRSSAGARQPGKERPKLPHQPPRNVAATRYPGTLTVILGARSVHSPSTEYATQTVYSPAGRARDSSKERPSAVILAPECIPGKS